MVTADWPGVDPEWSRDIEVASSSAADAPGTVRRWHLLDNGAQLSRRGLAPAGTLLCVHGNPTWSYLWRTLLAAGSNPAQPWRVVAVDQLDMGFSERTGTFRRLADRITDLGDLTDALELDGPVVTVGHDWGGVISLGWALDHPQQLAGVVLTNTAVHQPAGSPIPPALRLALHPAVHRWGTTTSDSFLRVTHSLAHPPLTPEVRSAFLAPYRGAARRAGVGNFVADIPADASHPSFPALTRVAEGLHGLKVPALMLWGPRDPIFSDRYLKDLITRLPEAKVHRFEGAGHLVAEDRDIATPIFEWLAGHAPDTRPVDADSRPAGADTRPAGADSRPVGADSRPVGAPVPSAPPLWAPLTELAAGPAGTDTAVAEMAADGTVARSLSWLDLERNVAAAAAGLQETGVGPGSRVSLMVPPGVDLTVVLYACLRLGAVVVVADAGLGTRGLSRAVKGATPDFLIGIDKALAAAAVLGWPGRRISVRELPAAQRRLLGVETSLAALARRGKLHAGTVPPVPAPDPDAPAAVLFTSGSTGPAKGVLYTHRRLAAMRDTVAATLGIQPGARLVAGFAPFALLGPALGAVSVTPAMDVTAPRTLTAQALADAAAAIGATVVFASPAALRNVLATRDSLSRSGHQALERVELLLSAGAPVAEPLLAAVQEILPSASLHTPYGMTEALPVTDISLEQIRAAEADAATGTMAGAGNGVCVGLPVHGARVALIPLAADGTAPGDKPVTVPAVTGEILVCAPHVKEAYDRLWLTQRDSARTAGWHRTGDVGHLDAAGRLWVEGRLAHVVTAPDAVITPVGAEQAIERLHGVGLAAVVGVGPAGTQAVAAVVETVPAARRAGPAAPQLAGRVREAAREAGVSVSAVLVVSSQPTDIRHNAKIDRTRLSRWASAVLAGGRAGTP
ncbi:MULTISPECIES: alpha/beta fold hydrolase [unclassified Arthrobacter]|uniref:alpha/beta fold hydrolase n=1 Tax=unclassified Arthrobacter TaxID=235627 RepID=UPI002DFACB7D|nr:MULTISPECIES: alpha/beta fold hydrolase [unclassified Arthrobacter]MEC5191016.1 acyl-CoA synthetase (AMP-forming)/AMP-acid ligase II/pimeloyl-ACP methyl ester carboxylesterase [Arthrobacter sp. MP_M4]MEC5202187.1 acyl-CoA synthetase (AMP-forming)/AMP-acid ligase II/pimeloyl-ACP methyl ester carboxylesterase [Arthrobacter sp. MP_M7]